MKCISSWALQLQAHHKTWQKKVWQITPTKSIRKRTKTRQKMLGTLLLNQSIWKRITKTRQQKLGRLLLPNQFESALLRFNKKYLADYSYHGAKSIRKRITKTGQKMLCRLVLPNQFKSAVLRLNKKYLADYSDQINSKSHNEGSTIQKRIKRLDENAWQITPTKSIRKHFTKTR